MVGSAIIFFDNFSTILPEQCPIPWRKAPPLRLRWYPPSHWLPQPPYAPFCCSIISCRTAWRCRKRSSVITMTLVWLLIETLGRLVAILIRHEFGSYPFAHINSIACRGNDSPSLSRSLCLSLAPFRLSISQRAVVSCACIGREQSASL